MAAVRPQHRLWHPLMPVVGALLAAAGVSAHEVGIKCGSAVSTDIPRSAPAAPLPGAVVPESDRLSPDLRPDRSGFLIPCSGACGDHVLTGHDLDRHASSRLGHGGPDTPPSRVESNRPAGAAREPALPLRSHKHRLVFHKFARANDPNDDGTSRDPSDDETSDDYAANDGTDLPIAPWFQDLVRCSVILEDESAPVWIETRSPPSQSPHPLRC